MMGKKQKIIILNKLHRAKNNPAQTIALGILGAQGKIKLDIISLILYIIYPINN